MQKLIILALVLVLLPLNALAFGKKRPKLPEDSVQAAILANDATGLVEGCGAQPIVGFTYCRQVEGDAASQAIDFIGPPAACKGDGACVFVKVFNQAGQVAWGGEIPRGKTRVSVPWKTLLGSDAFQVGNRGFWSWNLEVHWTDADGNDRLTRTQGDILLRVYRAGYTPLDKVSSDPAFAWHWIDGAFEYKMTTGGRAYVGRVQ